MIVEPSVMIGGDLKSILESRGYLTSDIFKSGEKALRAAEKSTENGDISFDIALVKMRLPDRDGMEIARELYSKYGMAIIYLNTDRTKIEMKKILNKFRSVGCLEYPFRDSDLTSLLDKFEKNIFSFSRQ